MPRFLQKIGFRIRRQGATPPPTSSTPATTPQPCSPPSEPSPASLQERLWSQAYDELKANRSEIVEAYEKFLSAELQTGGSAMTNNNIHPTSEGRQHQMKQLVWAGLQRTEKEAAVKQQIGDGIQVASFVKGLIGEGMRAVPEAALAWVGVSFALEVSLTWARTTVIY